jgi:hypothetical protein
VAELTLAGGEVPQLILLPQVPLDQEAAGLEVMGPEILERQIPEVAQEVVVALQQVRQGVLE